MGPSIGPPLCRETPVYRTENMNFSKPEFIFLSLTDLNCQAIKLLKAFLTNFQLFMTADL